MLETLPSATVALKRTYAESTDLREQGKRIFEAQAYVFSR